MTHGVYEIIDHRNYLDMPPGTRFVARLDSRREVMAVNRGAIRLVKKTTPGLQEGGYRLPPGWATRPRLTTEAPEGASSIEGGK